MQSENQESCSNSDIDDSVKFAIGEEVQCRDSQVTKFKPGHWWLGTIVSVEPLKVSNAWQPDGGTWREVRKLTLACGSMCSMPSGAASTASTRNEELVGLHVEIHGLSGPFSDKMACAVGWVRGTRTRRNGRSCHGMGRPY